MKKLFIILLCLLSLTFIYSQIELPIPIDKNSVYKHFEGFIIEYCEEWEQPRWVAYELTSEEAKGKINRVNKFKADLKITSGSASLADYRGSGYDRGHLAPSADMKWSKKAMEDCFLLSNMSPQLPEFNRGIWKRLEDKIRKWAIKYENIYIVTGGVVTLTPKTIGINEVAVPYAFYKVVLDLNNNKAIGFLIPHGGSYHNLMDYAVNIDSIEEITNLDFFPSLDDELEENLESKIDINLWK